MQPLLNGRDITKMEKMNEGIIVIGNESKGISNEILKLVKCSNYNTRKRESRIIECSSSYRNNLVSFS